MERKITGAIIKIDETKTFDSGFQKREFVIKTDEEYPQEVKLSIVQDKCTLLDRFAEGQIVDVSFDIRGNEYNGRHYIDLQAWKVFAQDGANASEPQKVEPQGDGLPF